MDEMTKEYTLKALDRRIKDLNSYIQWQSDIIKQSERELRTKTGSTMQVGSFSATMEYYEDSSTKLLNEATGRREKAMGNLEKYKHARENIANIQK